MKRKFSGVWDGLVSASTDLYPEEVSCRNHMPDEGFLMFAHKIDVHYTDGKVDRRKDWYSSPEISEMWNDDVEDINILFSDV